MLFLRSSLACTVGLASLSWHLRNFSLSQNSKLMEWLCASCVLCVGLKMLKLILLHACRIDFTQLFFDDWAKVTLHTPCTLFHVHYIGCNSLYICEKSHVLHAPAWFHTISLSCNLYLIAKLGRTIEIYVHVLSFIFRSFSGS